MEEFYSGRKLQKLKCCGGIIHTNCVPWVRVAVQNGDEDKYSNQKIFTFLQSISKYHLLWHALPTCSASIFIDSYVRLGSVFGEELGPIYTIPNLNSDSTIDIFKLQSNDISTKFIDWKILNAN